MRIGIVGGVPPALGSGGLDVQLENTAAALAELGHEVVRIERASGDARWEILHGFGAEPNLWHMLRNWTRERTPLIVTPVLVVSPGAAERLAVSLARVPILTGARMRRELLAASDAAVAATRYEAGLLHRLARGLPQLDVRIVPNGVDPRSADTPPPELPSGDWVLLVGAVTPRKRQRETVEALARGGVRCVVAGAWGGAERDRPAFEAAMVRAGATRLAKLSPDEVRVVLRRARAFVHLSHAEVQSLAVLEALGEGTPSVLSDIPSHRELAAEHPELVRIVSGPEEVAAALHSLPLPPRSRPPGLPTWGDVAGRLVEVYEDVLAAA